MPNPVTVMDLMLAVNVMTRAVPKIGETWGDGAVQNANKMYERRNTRIASEMDYLNYAELAQQESQNVISPSFISRSGKHKNQIDRVRAHKLKKGWEKAATAWEHQMGNGAEPFKNKVRAMQGVYGKRVSETTLAFTGIRAIESGPVRIAICFISGDPRSRGLLRPSDRILQPSQPFSITAPEKRNSLRILLNSRLIQNGMAVLHSELDPAVINEVNQINNSLAQSLVDPSLGIIAFTTGGLSRLDYVNETGQLYLAVRVARS